MVKSKITGSLEQAKKQFVADIETQALRYIEKTLIPQIEDDINKLFKRTTYDWGLGQAGSQSRRKNYPKPSPDFEMPDVEITAHGDKGLTIEFNVGFTAKANGEISKLWYILDFGRDDGTWDAPYPSAWFLPQSAHRTVPDQLHVNSARSYIRIDKPDGWLNNEGTAKVENGLLYIRKMPGDTWAGIPATNWSKLIAEEIQKIYKKRGFKVTFTRKVPK